MGLRHLDFPEKTDQDGLVGPILPTIDPIKGPFYRILRYNYNHPYKGSF